MTFSTCTTRVRLRQFSSFFRHRRSLRRRRSHARRRADVRSRSLLTSSKGVVIVYVVLMMRVCLCRRSQCTSKPTVAAPAARGHAAAMFLAFRCSSHAPHLCPARVAGQHHCECLCVGYDATARLRPGLSLGRVYADDTLCFENVATEEWLSMTRGRLLHRLLCVPLRIALPFALTLRDSRRLALTHVTTYTHTHTHDDDEHTNTNRLQGH